jgi:ferritin
MVKKNIEAEFNVRINQELYSWYLYLAMAAYFEGKNLKGAAAWMRAQAGEEMAHAMKNFAYLQSRNGAIKLASLAEPPAEWNSPLAAFEAAYAHEKEISAAYNTFTELAMKENDHATQIFLQWFVNEQVEEEASVLEVVERLRLVKDSPQGLFIIDRELAARAAG